MTTQLWIYLIVLPFAVLIITACFEYDREISDDPKDKEATLASALAGFVLGCIWPFVLGCLLFVGLLWCISKAGAAILGLVYN